MSFFKIITVLLFFVLFSGKSYANNKEIVVVLHGLSKTSKHLEPLANYLKDDFEVINVDYPSTEYKIEELSDQLYKKYLSKIDQNRKINFVGFSMGGLLTRDILNKHRYKNLNRVVFIASPHYGTEIADFFENNYFYKKIFGPAGAQLTTVYDLDSLLGKPYYEFAVIASNKGALKDLFFSYLIEGEDDGKVSVQSAKLKGAGDFVMVKSAHSLFPKNEDVQKQVLSYLKTGKFVK